MANIYAALNEALSQLRGEVTRLKECLGDPLGTVQKLESRLATAYKRNERLDRDLRALKVQHEELENFLWSRGELEDHIQVLESSVEEKDKEIARISQQTNELRYPRSPQKITEIVNSTDNLTISDKSNTIGKLEKEKSDLSEQLRIAIRERDDEHQKWLTARKDKEIMREVFKSNEYTREQLLEENKALYEQGCRLESSTPASLSIRPHCWPKPFSRIIATKQVFNGPSASGTSSYKPLCRFKRSQNPC
jgi:myosin heavy subunit